MFRSTAHVYDLIYESAGKDYAAEAAEVHAQIQQRNPTARSLLDVACGTGGHLAHLRAWYEVSGVDLDPGMLDQARSRVTDLPLVEGDMRSFDVGRTFDAVICLFSSIGYMPSADDLATAVSRMAAHLEPGGVLVVDGWVRPEAWRDPGIVSAEVGRGDGIAVARVGRSRRSGIHTFLDLHHLVATNEGVDHLVDHHTLTLFTVEEYEGACRAAELTVERVPSPIRDRDRYIGVKAPDRVAEQFRAPRVSRSGYIKPA